MNNEMIRRVSQDLSTPAPYQTSISLKLSKGEVFRGNSPLFTYLLGEAVLFKLNSMDGNLS